MLTFTCLLICHSRERTDQHYPRIPFKLTLSPLRHSIFLTDTSLKHDCRSTVIVMATLAELVQDLLAEIYNEILELTLTFPKKIYINEGMFMTRSQATRLFADLLDYASPAQLQISRATRARAMENMVNDTIFCADDENGCDLARWMASLDHLVRLPTVHYDGEPSFQRHPIAPSNPRDEAKEVFVNLLIKMMVCNKYPDAPSQKQKYDQCIYVREKNNGVSRWVLGRSL